MAIASPNTEPIFIATPFLVAAKLTSQVVTRSGQSGLPLELLTAGENGALVESITAYSLNTGGEIIRLYVDADAGYHMIGQLALPGDVSANSDLVLAMTDTFTLPPLLAPAGATGLRLAPAQSLYVALAVTSANGVQLVVQGGHY